MSFLSAVKIKLGLNPTATDNFVIESTGAGTGRIRKGDFSTVGSDVLTWDASNKVAAPSGFATNQLGYASTTTNQTGITTMVDLTSLTVTVTVLAGQRIQIEGYCYTLSSSVATDYVVCAIHEGATPLAYWSAIGSGSPKPTCVLSPTAGSHTYNLKAYRSGTGTASTNTGAVDAFILVKAI